MVIELYFQPTLLFSLNFPLPPIILLCFLKNLPFYEGETRGRTCENIHKMMMLENEYVKALFNC